MPFSLPLLRLLLTLLYYIRFKAVIHPKNGPKLNFLVVPTNNIAECIVRQGVLWHKSSFGTQSELGACYVERILTVCATCRFQGRSVIEYSRDACRCHLDRIPAPSSINPTDHLAKSA
jgi:hypothetical protein